MSYLNVSLAFPLMGQLAGPRLANWPAWQTGSSKWFTQWIDPARPNFSHGRPSDPICPQCYLTGHALFSSDNLQPLAGFWYWLLILFYWQSPTLGVRKLRHLYKLCGPAKISLLICALVSPSAKWRFVDLFHLPHNGGSEMSGINM